MILYTLLLLPVVAAILIWPKFRDENWWRWCLLGGALGHFVLSIVSVFVALDSGLLYIQGRRGMVALDREGAFFLIIISVIFLLVAVHVVFWQPLELLAVRSQLRHGTNRVLANGWFGICLLLFLASMTLVTVAQNFGLMWVAIEATTLVSAPLIMYLRSDRSLEAMWKYLLICSVGIGLALFGTLLLGAAAGTIESYHGGLDFRQLKAYGGMLPEGWLKAAFIFALIGYGTKAGFAPLHSWLPDAYSEAPSPASALLSGALLNCSFLTLIRFYQIMPGELQEFCRELLVFMGMFSLVTAAFFIIRQGDFKRMVAYSSIEHLGLTALLWGFGAEELALLHLAGHSLLKAALFLLSGNMLLICGTRRIERISGLLKKAPFTSILWLVGVLLICGTPPSPLFVTEVGLIRLAGPVLGTVILVLLFAVMAGMSWGFLHMTMGKESPLPEPLVVCEQTEKRLVWIPSVALVLALVLGVVMIYQSCQEAWR